MRNIQSQVKGIFSGIEEGGQSFFYSMFFFCLLLCFVGLVRVVFVCLIDHSVGGFKILFASSWVSFHGFLARSPASRAN